MTLTDLGQWLQESRPLLILAVAAFFLLVVLQRFLERIRGMIRRRGPVRINPKLQKYADRSIAETESDRQSTEKIIATSSTGTVAGYEIVKQIEAVFVEGERSPEEAMKALKAAAGRLGANAITNLSVHRTMAGRCTAQGDAVFVLVRSTVQPESGGKLERERGQEGHARQDLDKPT